MHNCKNSELYLQKFCYLESAFEVEFAGELTGEGVSELGAGAGDYRRTSEAARWSSRTLYPCAKVAQG